MATPIIRVHDVGKQFLMNQDKSLKERLVVWGRGRPPKQWFTALEGVSFDLPEGQTLGLIGHNGSGKSTLLKIIGGILTPNAGYVERRGRLAALLELGAGFHPDLTGRENVHLNASILGLSRRQTQGYFDAIVDFSGIEQFIDTQVKFYSSGMYVRLAFAVAVHVEPDVLLVDEVLSVGDEPFQRKCLDKIKSFQREGRTIVLVTHSLDLTRQLCNRVLLFEHGHVLVDGLPTEALRMFRDRHAMSEAAADEQPGSGELEIVATRITDRDGRVRERFEPGDDIGIEVDVVAHQPVRDWQVGVAITNEVDTLIFGTDSRQLARDLGPIESGRRVRWLIPRVPMMEGQFGVSVSLSGPGGHTYHRRQQAARFRILSRANELGALHLMPELEWSDDVAIDEAPSAVLSTGAARE